MADTMMRSPIRRREGQDEFIASFYEMLALIRTFYDRTGDPHMRDIIARAEAAVGRVPR